MRTRWVFGLLSLILAGLFDLAFYDRYWRVRDCFNEYGRRYDPGTGQISRVSAAPLWSGLTSICGAIALRPLFGRRCK